MTETTDQATVEAEEPSQHDALVAEATPRQKPAGAPDFLPAAAALGSKNRRLRAEFFSKVRSFDDVIASEDVNGEYAALALLSTAVADVEEAMAMVVAPYARKAFEEWSAAASDQDIIDLFRWYMTTMNPGGSFALAELIDRYGRGIEFDFARYGLPPLSDYLAGRRPASQALRFIDALPPGSATLAMMRADPDIVPGKHVPSWRDHHTWDRSTDVLADVYDATLAAAPRAAGSSAPKPYPRPGKAPRPRSRALRNRTQ